jgi:hypothetical protein
VTTPVQGQPANEPVVTDAPQQQNTAPYQEYLDRIPEDLRGQIEPIFKEWDGNVTKQFQSLHSEYDPYKPLVEEYEASALQQAVALAKYMEEKPEEFLKQFMEVNGLSLEQGTVGTTPQQQGLPQQQQSDDPYEQRFGTLEQQLNQIVQALQGQQQMTQQQQQQAELDRVMGELHTKHGDFDDIYVLSLIGTGMDPEAAVNRFQQTVSQFGGSLQQQAPKVAGAGGSGYPQQQISAADLASGKVSSKDLAVQMLRNAAEQGN